MKHTITTGTMGKSNKQKKSEADTPERRPTSHNDQILRYDNKTNINECIMP